MALSHAIQVLHFPFGLLFGYFFYFSTLKRFKFDDETDLVVMLIMVTATLTFFMISVNFRCISCLVVPMFLGRNFRSLIITLIIAQLVTGPIDNITVNIQSSIKSVTCFVSLKKNQSLVKYKFLNEPTIRVQQALIDHGEIMRDKMKNLKDKKKILDTEMRDFSETAQLRANLSSSERGRAKVDAYDRRHDSSNKTMDDEFHEKQTMRCTDIQSQHRKECEDEIIRAQEECIANASVGCDKYSLWAQDCDEMEDDEQCEEVAPENIEYNKDYETLSRNIDEMDADLNVTTTLPQNVTVEETVNVTIAEDYQQMVKKIFFRKSLWLRAILQIMDYILVIIFIIIFVSAYNYNKYYQKNIYHDNIYVGEYFRRIDLRRRRRFKMTLIPLKALDKKQLVDVYSFRLLPDEKQKILVSFIIMTIALLTVLMVLYVDFVISSLLTSFVKHGHVNYEQRGWRTDDYNVTGTGQTANRIRSILNEFSNKSSSFGYLTSTEPCLPQESVTSRDSYLNLLGLFILWLALALTEAYFVRTRRLICGWFFRKREKKRILYLYNETLRQRKKMLVYKIDRALKEKEEARKHGQVNPDEVVIIPRNVNNCRLCDEEPVEAVQCGICDLKYCHQCWDALKQICLNCNNRKAFASNVYSKFHDDEVTRHAGRNT